MAATAERMKAMRERRKRQGMREVRLIVPDMRLKEIRNRIALQAASLDPHRESDALTWMESVSDFDANETR